MGKKRRLIRLFGNILFILAIGLSLYLLIGLFIVRRSLPPGVCPIDNKRPLMYIAIALALSSFVLTFIENRIKDR
ncbi:MAG TPA: hypothetical protein VFD89_00995 [Clostridia bacterium]|nr:hypothetical protein [Clostridia bacterium]